LAAANIALRTASFRYIFPPVDFWNRPDTQFSQLH
jgi:hypothetical protein